MDRSFIFFVYPHRARRSPFKNHPLDYIGYAWGMYLFLRASVSWGFEDFWCQCKPSPDCDGPEEYTEEPRPSMSHTGRAPLFCGPSCGGGCAWFVKMLQNQLLYPKLRKQMFSALH
jgi:hypothetical protein